MKALAPQDLEPDIAVEAAKRSGSEDQLTLAFAWTLRRNAQFARALMRKAGIRLPRTVTRFEVETFQRFALPRAPNMRRVGDLAVTAYEAAKPVARLWCENKLYAPVSRGQLDDQLAGLLAASPAVANSQLALLVIDEPTVLRGVERRSTEFDGPVMTWFEIKDLLVATGARKAGANWIDRPKPTDEPTDLAALRAFVRWLERPRAPRDLRALWARPLSAAFLDAIAQGDSAAIRQYGAFLTYVSYEPSVRVFGESYMGPRVLHRDGSSRLYLDFVLLPAQFSAVYPDSWAANRLSLYIGVSLSGGAAPLGFQAGAWIPPTNAAGRFTSSWKLTSAEWAEWATRLSATGWSHNIAYRGRDPLYIWKEKPLGELLDAGPSITKQGRAAGAFAGRALKALGAKAIAPPRTYHPER